MATSSDPVVVIIGEDPWGTVMHLDLKQWALGVARRGATVVYVGPQSRLVSVTLPDDAVAPEQVAQQVLAQWLETTGRWRQGIYFLERLDAIQVGQAPAQPTAGLVERHLVAWSRRPLQVVLGYEDAQWLGGGASAVVRWPVPDAASGLVPAVTLHAQLRAPLPMSPAHPVAVVVGVTEANRALVHRLLQRASAWRFFVCGPAADGEWPPGTRAFPWPSLTEAEPSLLAASAVVIPPEAHAATVQAWCTWHTACWPDGDPCWVGPAPTDVRGSVLAAVSLDDYSRALSLLGWPEPRTAQEVAR